MKESYSSKVYAKEDQSTIKDRDNNNISQMAAVLACIALPGIVSNLNKKKETLPIDKDKDKEDKKEETPDKEAPDTKKPDNKQQELEKEILYKTAKVILAKDKADLDHKQQEDSDLHKSPKDPEGPSQDSNTKMSVADHIRDAILLMVIKSKDPDIFNLQNPDIIQDSEDPKNLEKPKENPNQYSIEDEAKKILEAPFQDLRDKYKNCHYSNLTQDQDPETLINNAKNIIDILISDPILQYNIISKDTKMDSSEQEKKLAKCQADFDEQFKGLDPKYTKIKNDIKASPDLLFLVFGKFAEVAHKLNNLDTTYKFLNKNQEEFAKTLVQNPSEEDAEKNEERIEEYNKGIPNLVELWRDKYNKMEEYDNIFTKLIQDQCQSLGFISDYAIDYYSDDGEPIFTNLDMQNACQAYVIDQKKQKNNNDEELDNGILDRYTGWDAHNIRELFHILTRKEINKRDSEDPQIDIDWLQNRILSQYGTKATRKAINNSMSIDNMYIEWIQELASNGKFTQFIGQIWPVIVAKSESLFANKKEMDQIKKVKAIDTSLSEDEIVQQLHDIYPFVQTKDDAQDLKSRFERMFGIQLSNGNLTEILGQIQDISEGEIQTGPTEQNSKLINKIKGVIDTICNKFGLSKENKITFLDGVEALSANNHAKFKSDCGDPISKILKIVGENDNDSEMDDDKEIIIDAETILDIHSQYNNNTSQENITEIMTTALGNNPFNTELRAIATATNMGGIQVFNNKNEQDNILKLQDFPEFINKLKSVSMGNNMQSKAKILEDIFTEIQFIQSFNLIKSKMGNIKDAAIKEKCQKLLDGIKEILPDISFLLSTWQNTQAYSEVVKLISDINTNSTQLSNNIHDMQLLNTVQSRIQSNVNNSTIVNNKKKGKIKPANDLLLLVSVNSKGKNILLDKDTDSQHTAQMGNIINRLKNKIQVAEPNLVTNGDEFFDKTAADIQLIIKDRRQKVIKARIEKILDVDLAKYKILAGGVDSAITLHDFLDPLNSYSTIDKIMHVAPDAWNDEKIYTHTKDGTPVMADEVTENKNKILDLFSATPNAGTDDAFYNAHVQPANNFDDTKILQLIVNKLQEVGLEMINEIKSKIDSQINSLTADELTKFKRHIDFIASNDLSTLITNAETNIEDLKK